MAQERTKARQKIHARRGRPPIAGTSIQRAASRREKVRLNVQRFRRREKGINDSLCTPHPRERGALIWVQETPEQSIPCGGIRQHVQPADIQVNSAATTRNSASPNPDKSISRFTESIRHHVTPSHHRQYIIPLIANFRQRFLPTSISFNTSSHNNHTLKSPCASWVNTACTLAQYEGNGALKDGVLAILFAFLGMEEQNKTLQVESFQLYLRTLNYIRQGLNKIISGKDIERTIILSLVISCHVAAVFELVINCSMLQMVQHIKGISMLIQQHGFGMDTVSGLLEDYQMFEMSFCMVYRCASTLSTQTKKKIRRPRALKDHCAESPQDGRSMRELLGIGDEILVLMVHIDNLNLDEATDSMCNDLRCQASKLMLIPRRIDEWLNAFGFGDEPVILEKEYTTTAYNKGPQEQLVTSFEMGSAWIYALSFKLYAFETCIGALNTIETVFPMSDVSKIGICIKCGPGLRNNSNLSVSDMRSQIREITHMLSRSLPYFLEKDIGVIGRSLVIFPLEAGFNAVENEMKRLVNDRFHTETTGLSRADWEINMKRKIDGTSKDLALFLGVASRAKELRLPLFGQR